MPVPEWDTSETEISEVRSALSEFNWKLGRACREWLRRHGSRYKIADFAASIGLSEDQVHQRLRVWMEFGPVRGYYTHLSWSHFYAATQFSGLHEAHECLKWANEMRATVAEMKAWRRAQRGEDLREPETPTGSLF